MFSFDGLPSPRLVLSSYCVPAYSAVSSDLRVTFFFTTSRMSPAVHLGFIAYAQRIA